MSEYGYVEEPILAGCGRAAGAEVRRPGWLDLSDETAMAATIARRGPLVESSWSRRSCASIPNEDRGQAKLPWRRFAGHVPSGQADR